jgi:hypothetical protein
VRPVGESSASEATSTSTADRRARSNSELMGDGVRRFNGGREEINQSAILRDAAREDRARPWRGTSRELRASMVSWASSTGRWARAREMGARLARARRWARREKTEERGYSAQTHTRQAGRVRRWRGA